MGSNDYTEIRIDPSSVRGFAEKMYAEYLHNLKPNVDRIRGDLVGGAEGSGRGQWDGTPAKGYLFGRSANHHPGGSLTAIHDQYAQEADRVLVHIALGYQAIANAAACVAETATSSDDLNALDVIDATEAFRPDMPATTEPDNYGHPEDTGGTPVSTVF